MKHKRYLVTGGTGFIGNNLVHALVRSGEWVRVFDNNSRGYVSRLADVKKHIEYVDGDIRDFSLVKKACQDIDSIIHLAYINGTEFFYTKPELVLDVGVTGMFNIIKAAIEKNVPELFLASSSEVYATPSIVPTPETVPLVIPDVTNPRFSYSGGKILSELLTSNFGKKYFKRAVIFRPHNVYGPDMGKEHGIPQMISRMLQFPNKKNSVQLFPIQGSGKESRSYCFINDAIDAILLLLEKGKHLEIYNIGTADEISTKKLALLIAMYLNKKIKIQAGKLQPGSPLRRCPDIFKIENLGYRPKITLAKGLSETIKWYTTHHE